jgi:hypothetical protein
MPDVGDHVTAGFFTLAAFLGTHFHMLVIGKVFAFLTATGTGLFTGFADEVHKRPPRETICAAATQKSAQS